MCLRYILSQINDEKISHFIVGVNESNHLVEIIKEIKLIKELDIHSFELNDNNLINPSLWKIT